MQNSTERISFVVVCVHVRCYPAGVCLVGLVWPRGRSPSSSSAPGYSLLLHPPLGDCECEGEQVLEPRVVFWRSVHPLSALEVI